MKQKSLFGCDESSWRVGGQMNRPTCRWSGEQAGVPIGELAVLLGDVAVFNHFESLK